MENAQTRQFNSLSSSVDHFMIVSRDWWAPNPLTAIKGIGLKHSPF